MNDLHISSGAYALNALDDHERAICEAHLARCPECRAEVAGFVDTATQLASTSEITPPTELRARVLSGIKQVRPLPPETSKHRADDVASDPTPDNVIPMRRPRWVPRLAAAAAVVVVLGGGAAVWHPWDHTTRQLADSPVDQVLTASDAVSLTKHPAIGGEVTIVRSVSRNGAVIKARDLPTLPSGKVYELWFQKPNANMVPAGILNTSRPTLLKGDAVKAAGAGITVEPAAGSTSPTTPPVALFVFGQSP